MKRRRENECNNCSYSMFFLSFLQDLDATTGLALKIKQEPFAASSGQIYGEYTECCLVDGTLT